MRSDSSRRVGIMTEQRYRRLKSLAGKRRSRSAQRHSSLQGGAAHQGKRVRSGKDRQFAAIEKKSRPTVKGKRQQDVPRGMTSKFGGLAKSLMLGGTEPRYRQATYRRGFKTNEFI